MQCALNQGTLDEGSSPSFCAGRKLGVGEQALLWTLGIRLRRDNWVSVRYAEALNSGKSSVTLQRTDRHGILDQKRADFQESL